MVVSKRLVPWFDERIQDSQMGRQLHLEHMHASGLGFVVHPHAFIVKQPVLDGLPHQLTKQILQADVRLVCLCPVALSVPHARHEVAGAESSAVSACGLGPNSSQSLTCSLSGACIQQAVTATLLYDSNTYVCICFVVLSSVDDDALHQTSDTGCDTRDSTRCGLLLNPNYTLKLIVMSCSDACRSYTGSACLFTA